MSERLGNPNHSFSPGGAAAVPERDVDAVLARLAALRQELFGFFVERRTRREGEAPTRLQLHLLMRLYEHGGSTVSEVAEFLGVSRPTASQLATALTERGWLARETEQDDRRRHRVILTETGRALVRARKEARDARLRRVIARLTPEERAILVALAERIASLLVEDAEGEQDPLLP